MLLNFDASDNVISGNEPSSEMLTSQKPECANTGNGKTNEYIHQSPTLHNVENI